MSVYTQPIIEDAGLNVDLGDYTTIAVLRAMADTLARIQDHEKRVQGLEEELTSERDLFKKRQDIFARLENEFAKRNVLT